ncbi:extracellular superoxide dismutase [Cu-Zn] [Python bivittatus]|uniref:Superoxide dismutase [Cu-Zn] n=1 Tax=Python bivittatus TaxID=176946 RepID=A0A9F2NWJ4_PYTBI|nr:extracellular superoxide dismutase [Cu-Zn] [Python bivittatus]XP_007428962.1 extracellular superoxide dismutase [Cu-Zn] [Python bivittatus]
MILLLFLTPSLILCDTNVTMEWEDAPPAISPLVDMQKKINDLWLSLLYPQLYEEIITANRTAYASCSVKPNSKLESGKPHVTGQVLFRQSYPHGQLEVIFLLAGFPTGTNLSGRAIHIHQHGDLSNGCDSVGGHYNPWKVNHPHHPGDFGNFYSKEGKIKKFRSNLRATLFGPQTILGRSVVIHEQEDDLGKGNNQASLENGNAGKRLACCVIGTCNHNLWEKHFPDVTAKRKKRVIKQVRAGQA